MIFGDVHQWVFEHIVQPPMFALGMANAAEDGFVGTEWFLIGLVEISVMLLVLKPLEWWRPVESVTDRKTVWTDVIYTLVHRLGAFRLALFLALDPVFDVLREHAHAAGISGFHLDNVWPGVTDIAIVVFVIYLVTLDFVGYWLHRAQHQLNAWWALNSLHHAQRQMTMWSDNRNHLLDDLLIDVAMVAVAAAIGVPPEQFILLVVLSRIMESLQHANVRLSFGALGERLIVSPRFHRYHHSIGAGHESQGKGTLGGHNFGVLFPWWDVLFGTADFSDRYDATGVRDQLPDEGARNYGGGFWQQQWFGLKRLVGKA